MKQGYCKQHKNSAQLICLHPQCQNRLMCMLCEHNHDFFSSLRAKTQVNWVKFKKAVDSSIDKSLKIVDEIEQGGIESQKKMVARYYNSIKEDICRFLDIRMAENLALFQADLNSNLQVLIRSRIEGRYHELAQAEFQKIKEVYEGKNLQEMAREEQQLNLERAYNFMEQFHKECQLLFHRFKIQFKVKVPEIRIKAESNVNSRGNATDYEEEIYRNKQQSKIKWVTDAQIEMLVTDGYSGKHEIVTIGFDKTLRVFDKNLKLIRNHEFTNVLTRIEPISESIFAIGVSKQLHIKKLSSEDAYDLKHILTLKGHNERIWDISTFNTRIIGSSSEEGTKIWDLYKQKCEYTLREQINPSCIQFMSSANMLAVGYHTHVIKIYSLSNMKPSRSYQFSGVPLYMSQQNRNENVLYCGGFKSDLKLLDIRVAKEVFSHLFQSEAVTSFRESVFEEETLLVGERGGKVRLFDLRKLKTRFEWQGHTKTTNLSKPNGVVRIFQQNFNQVLTIGSNDRKAIVWQVSDES